jgi:hypothetical protein
MVAAKGMPGFATTNFHHDSPAALVADGIISGSAGAKEPLTLSTSTTFIQEGKSPILACVGQLLQRKNR